MIQQLINLIRKKRNQDIKINKFKVKKRGIDTNIFIFYYLFLILTRTTEIKSTKQNAEIKKISCNQLSIIQSDKKSQNMLKKSNENYIKNNE